MFFPTLLKCIIKEYIVILQHTGCRMNIIIRKSLTPASIWSQAQIRAGNLLFLFWLEWDGEDRWHKSIYKCSFQHLPLRLKILQITNSTNIRTSWFWLTRHSQVMHRWTGHVGQPTASPTYPVHLCMTWLCRVNPNQLVLLFVEFVICNIFNLRYVNNYLQQRSIKS